MRVVFPFEQDTAAAVFRRGDTVWMLFDTPTAIDRAAEHSDALTPVASGFSVIPAGDTQVVRLDLASERLATLGSEGRSWVLSLGDVLLNADRAGAAQPPPRRARAQFEMTADLAAAGARSTNSAIRWSATCSNVVTAFPPARGVVARRSTSSTSPLLRSVHGLVIKPRERRRSRSRIDGRLAVIHGARRA